VAPATITTPIPRSPAESDRDRDRNGDRDRGGAGRTSARPAADAHGSQVLTPAEDSLGGGPPAGHGRGVAVRLRHRAVAVPLTALVVVALAALVGWQARWPAAIFGGRPAAATRPGTPTFPAASKAALPTPSATAPSPLGGSSTSPAASPSAASPSSTGPLGPAGTVGAYFAAINRHQDRLAWRLGGDHAGGSYQNFVNGLAGTAHDSVTIVSVHGNVVTAKLAALQSSGSTNRYEGTYTVVNGIIIAFHVRQVS
jgi:hypothetical protein